MRPQPWPTDPTPARSPSTPRRKLVMLAALAVAVAVVVVVAAMALATPSAPPLADTAAAHTPSGSTTAGTSATPMVLGTVVSSPATTSTTCANAPGSNAVYAYVGSDEQLFLMHGCATPVQATHLASPNFAVPLAWSPSNRYLAYLIDEPNSSTDCHMVLDTQTLTSVTTTFCSSDNNFAPQYTLLGWLDDATLVEMHQYFSNSDHYVSSQIIEVNRVTLAQTTITTLPWASNVELRAGALIYAALDDLVTGAGSLGGPEGNAHLHRFDLTTKQDTTLVSLGIGGNGGCDQRVPCNWTAPWDFSPNGADFIYHSPGATSLPSVNPDQNTPILVATLGGSGAGEFFTNTSFDHFSYYAHDDVLRFAPDGQHVLAVNTQSYTGGVQAFSDPTVELVSQKITDSYAWRSDSAALVVEIFSIPQVATPMLFTLATGALTALPVGEGSFLWGH